MLRRPSAVLLIVLVMTPFTAPFAAIDGARSLFGHANAAQDATLGLHKATGDDSVVIKRSAFHRAAPSVAVATGGAPTLPSFDESFLSAAAQRPVPHVLSRSTVLRL